MHVHSYCRQMAGCYSDVSDIFVGTKGRADILKHASRAKTPGITRVPSRNMYDAEHQALFAAIRSGNTINNGLYMARSTMLAILGRMVDWTGDVLTWEQAINSQQVLAPAIRLRRRSAHPARQGRPLSDRHAGRDEVCLTPPALSRREMGLRRLAR